jgi:hypothetical protein
MAASEQQDQPSLEKKRTTASAFILENYIKIRVSLFPRYKGLIKGGEEAMLEGESRPHHAARKLGRVVGPNLALARPLVSPLR